MKKSTLSIPEQVSILLDGRTQRWLSFEIKVPESDLSRKMKGSDDFTEEEIEKINTRLNGNIPYLEAQA